MEAQHLVVILPGIGGTRLVVPDDPSRVVWDVGMSAFGNALVHRSRLGLDENPRLRPAGLINSLTFFGFWTPIRGYEGLVGRLAALDGMVLDDGHDPGPRPGANLLAIGYDFRLGIAAASEHLDAQLQPRLRELWPNPDDQRGRIIFVAHSMGGLVARHWLAQDGNAALCRELITLGTPHRGAPKALDMLANGIPVAGLRIKGGWRKLLRSWQGVYDLLPTAAEIEDLTADGNQPRWRDSYGIPLQWDSHKAAAAKAVHADIRKAWSQMPADVRPSVQPRIGLDHGTQRRCVWNGRRVVVTSDDPTREGMGAWATRGGDGTVPALSALPREMSEAPTTLWAPFRHGNVVNMPEAIDRVRDAGLFPNPRLIEAEQVQMALGIDMEELAIGGTPQPLSVTVNGIDISDDPGRCVATIRRVGEPGIQGRVDLEWDSVARRFSGELPELPPGGFTARVDWAADDALRCDASLEVLDPDQLDLQEA